MIVPNFTFDDNDSDDRK